MKKQYIIVIIISLLLLQLASAKTYHMTLLTVGEVGEREIGGTADAYLDIKPGSGRIFLDSFPLTKIDTQISTRYASRVACDYLDIDCTKMDFFYTIRADSTIVGGPSASAPLTVLTIAALKDIPLRNDTVMTGTINSGGSIGPVGGVPMKAKAAQSRGFTRVLVPLFSIDMTEAQIGNATAINITSPGNYSTENLSIEIIRIRNIDEAIYHYTGKSLARQYSETALPDEYVETMQVIANGLCNRALILTAHLNDTDMNRSIELKTNINSSLGEKNFYSAASYCFNLGVMIRRSRLDEIDKTDPARIEQLKQVTLSAAKEFEENLEAKNLTTISELETYIIVKERLEESIAALSENDTRSQRVAYAIERYYSAVEWSRFFGYKSKELDLDTQYLEEACYKKISEAEERINYAGIYLPHLTGDSQESVNEAYSYAQDGNYKMCLFKASFGKAESNLLLSSISVSEGQIVELADEKIKAARNIIAKEQSDGVFPILGYSYIEYSDSLNRNGESISSLIFSEYALELSNLRMYFPEKSAIWSPRVDSAMLAFGVSVFALGLAAGIGTSAIIMRKDKPTIQKRKARKLINPKKTSDRGLPGKKR